MNIKNIDNQGYSFLSINKVSVEYVQTSLYGQNLLEFLWIKNRGVFCTRLEFQLTHTGSIRRKSKQLAYSPM